jgi:hypothetical protein
MVNWAEFTSGRFKEVLEALEIELIARDQLFRGAINRHFRHELIERTNK